MKRSTHCEKEKKSLRVCGPGKKKQRTKLHTHAHKITHACTESDAHTHVVRTYAPGIRKQLRERVVRDLLDLNLITTDWLDEMKVAGITAAALVLRGELGEAETEMFVVHQGLLALVALDAGRAARAGGEEIVAVHGAYLVSVPIPRREAERAGDFIRAHQAEEANGCHVGGVVVLALDREGGVTELDRREEESAVQQRELVVHGHFAAA